MKTKLVAAFLTLGAVTLLVGAEPKKTDKPVLKKPELKIDATPVGDSKAPVVASYADVLTDIRNSVVSVYSSKIVREQIPPFFRQLYGNNVQGREQRQEGLGSGVIVSADGYILTNNHVVADADELKVQLNDDREFTAKVVGTDPKTDIAVIKIDSDKLPAATLADSDKLRVGDIVFAIGNPLAVGQTVTMGIISATGRRVGILEEVGGYEDFIQTDASINQGNSGGALIDAKGRLVGINSAIISNNRGSIGIGFAIPVNLARNIMNSLIETGTVARGYMGVAPDVLTPELAESFNLPKDTKGVVIADLTSPSSPAAKAGLKREDIIIGVNDKAVSSPEDLRLFISQNPPGTKVKVKYLRDGKTLTTDVTLERLDDGGGNEGELLPGVTVQMLDDDARRKLRIDDRVEGLLITEHSPQSRYADTFPAGAVIEQINRAPVTDLRAAKAALQNGRNMALVYYRGIYRYVVFNVSNR
ncbi:MAG TPA: Do family serine endopeptidase [Candidatus Didemnitutus sp.]|nr:Do family serine endopeptidase [Candidatus Didemnitutus sp.]